jgi:YebC/PmpR family DNA-binding regulatory protein
MSGHNKWSKIKHKKGNEDAKKSKVFSKISRLITMQSKISNGDINSPNLKSAIEKARVVNMPNDNIQRAVKKGIGSDSGNMESVLYEAYGPGGSAIIIDGLTDNKNRTGAEVKHILSKNGLALASQGSASWAFENIDGIWKPKNTINIEQKEAERLKSIIEEFEENDDIQNIYTNIKID